MCGVAGVFGISDNEVAGIALQKMMSRMVHRGPDSEGEFVKEGIALGHQRLKIIDLSSSADQPFISEDGRYTLVFNGEIYNYQEIADELKETPFRTSSDTEVLLRAFMKWGPNCLSRLNGMFAFAIWDAQKEELFIARDRLGIKPLYFARITRTFLFASELRALLASDLIERKLNKRALQEYMQYQTVHAPQTLVEGVNMLLPGHYMTVSKGQAQTHRYWHPVHNRRSEFNEHLSEKEIRAEFRNAVGRRMIADVPLGAFLSGGIDSSAIVGLMAELSEEPVHTFSVVFEDKAFSEEAYAELIAKKFNTKHTVLRLHSKQLLQRLPEILKAIDHPSVDGPNTYMVSEATKNAGITVAMSGLGGDELFAGYPVFQQLPKIISSKVMALPISLRKAGSFLGASVLRSAKSHKALALLKEEKSALALYPHFRKAMRENEISKLLNEGNSNLSTSAFEAIFNESKQLSVSEELLSWISSAEIQTYMQNVLLRDADQMSMAHALEIRVPFLDHNLVELAMGLSDQTKIPTYPKRSLVESLDGLLPNEIVHRKKMGFTFPWRTWLQNEMSHTCYSAIQALNQYSCFNAEALNELWLKFKEGATEVNWTHIWSLVVLYYWMSENEIDA